MSCSIKQLCQDSVKTIDPVLFIESNCVGFFKEVLQNENDFDAFVKFYGTCSLQFEQYDCILGLYAMRAKYFKMFFPLTIENYKSAEVALARYFRFTIPRLKEIDDLQVECCFGEEVRKLIV